MNAKNRIEILDLSSQFIDNINRQSYYNDKQNEFNVYKNSHITPSFRYYKDDTNLNFSSTFLPKFTYKNKSLFPREKPIQTEHDEIGINEAFLKKHFGYTDYGYYNVANQSLPEANKHKTTPKNKLYDLL